MSSRVPITPPSGPPLSEMSPDDLYSLVASIQAQGKETEVEIRQRQETTRHLKAAIDDAKRRICDEEAHQTHINAQLTEALRLADLAERLAHGAAESLSLAEGNVAAARELLWEWVETTPPLRRLSTTDTPVPRTETATRSPSASPLRTPPVEKGAAPPLWQRWQRYDIREVTDDVLTALGAMPATLLTVGREPAPHTTPPARSTQDTVDVSQPPRDWAPRKSITFVDDAHLVTVVVPVDAHNVSRQPWPQCGSCHDEEEEGENAAAAGEDDSGSTRRRRRASSQAQLTMHEALSRRAPTLAAAAFSTPRRLHRAPTTARPSAPVEMPPLRPQPTIAVASVAATVATVAALIRGEMTRRRTVWRLDKKP